MVIIIYYNFIWLLFEKIALKPIDHFPRPLFQNESTWEVSVKNIIHIELMTITKFRT